MTKDQAKVLAVYPKAWIWIPKPVNGIKRAVIYADTAPISRVLCDTTRSERFAWQTAARMLGTEVAK